MYRYRKNNNDNKENKGIFKKDKQSNIINLNPLHNKINNEIKIK
jgi:hypothetical protein